MINICFIFMYCIANIQNLYLVAVYLADVKIEDIGDVIDTKKYPPSIGMTIELCAGIVDKYQSLVETARDEVVEECGYNVPLSSLQKVMTYR